MSYANATLMDAKQCQKHRKIIAFNLRMYPKGTPFTHTQNPFKIFDNNLHRLAYPNQGSGNEFDWSEARYWN